MPFFCGMDGCKKQTGACIHDVLMFAMFVLVLLTFGKTFGLI